MILLKPLIDYLLKLLKAWALEQAAIWLIDWYFDRRQAKRKATYVTAN